MRGVVTLLALALAVAGDPAAPARAGEIVNDVTQLNPIKVEAVVQPATVEEVSRLVAHHPGPISIGGARHSQGGQTACAGCLFIDMRRLNRVLDIDEKRRLVTVEAGASWRSVQEALDPKNLSVAIMQDYANFTVGGALSVNAHGAYVGKGPVINSVRSIRIVLADGRVVSASREENPEIFYGAIGGYGGLGVIVEATLELADNRPLERTRRRMKLKDYKAFFFDKVEGRPGVVMHHGTLYPPEYRTVVAETLSETDRAPTVTARLSPTARPSPFDRATLDLVAGTQAGKAFRENVYDPLHPRRTDVVWRNYAASQDANGLEPASRARRTYVLQEYFVPVDRFDDFASKMATILKQSRADVLNVALRHTPPETGTLLSWAPREMFCFVLYYEQGVTPADRARVKTWTSELIQLSIDEGGDYYLPYQIAGTREQFLKAYPRAPEYFALKRRLDPSYKFRNSLWDAYYTP